MVIKKRGFIGSEEIVTIIISIFVLSLLLVFIKTSWTKSQTVFQESTSSVLNQDLQKLIYNQLETKRLVLPNSVIKLSKGEKRIIYFGLSNKKNNDENFTLNILGNKTNIFIYDKNIFLRANQKKIGMIMIKTPKKDINKSFFELVIKDQTTTYAKETFFLDIR